MHVCDAVEKKKCLLNDGSLLDTRKKPACDRCGFKGRYASQLLVYHIDGRLANCEPSNLRTVCLNCVEEVKRLDVPWQQSDLPIDR
jgi:hypothetical protein